MRPIPACTIATNSYLALASSWAASYRRHHPEASIVVCVVDEPSSEVDYARLPFDVVFIRDLSIPDFASFVFRYEVLELSTAVKPFLLRHLRDVMGFDAVFYFDPDIMVMDRLDGLIRAITRSSVVLTPHLLAPLDNRFRPPERLIRVTGIYNLGFLGIRLGHETEAFLEWWCDRLRTMCIAELTSGLFVDQGWMDFAPTYLDRVEIVRDPRFNVAYWNLPNRRVSWNGHRWCIDGRPVGFFHFSGVDFEHLDEVSRHQNRVDLDQLPWLRPLFEGYRAEVMGAGHEEFLKLGYSYGVFRSTRVPIPGFIRWLLHEVDPIALRWTDPFDVTGPDAFFDWIRRPFEVDGHIVNRTALALWRHREDIKAVFPKVPGIDLYRYRSWLLDDSSRPLTKLDESLLEPIRALKDRPWANGPGLTPGATAITVPHLPKHLEERWGATAWIDAERVRCADLDLNHPGTATDWLNEVVEGDASLGLDLTRLALILHRRDADLQRLFPDPLGDDRSAFAMWLESHGSERFGLDETLLQAIRRDSPQAGGFRSMVAGWFRRRRRSERSPWLLSSSNANACATGSTRCRVSSLGVNLVVPIGYPEHDDPYAVGVAECLRRADLGLAEVPLSDPLPQILTAARVRYPQGVPYPVTIAVGRVGETLDRWRDLESVVRTRDPAVGYWDARGILQLDDPRVLARAVNEVWVYSADHVDAVAAATDLPTYHMPPPLMSRRLPVGIRGARPLTRGEDFSWHVSCHPERMLDLLETIDVVSSIAAAAGSRLRIVVEVLGPAESADPVRRKLADSESIEVVSAGRVTTSLQRLATCDAVMDLHGDSPVATIVLAAAMGRTLVGRRYGPLRDVVDADGDFVISGRIGDRIDGSDITRVVEALGRLENLTAAAASAHRRARAAFAVDTAGPRIISRVTELLRRQA
jgi:hypothetical protein